MKKLFLIVIFLTLGKWCQAATTWQYKVNSVCNADVASERHVEMMLTVVEGTDTFKVKLPSTPLSEFKTSPSKEEGIEAAIVLIRYLIRQFPPGTSNATIKNAIEAKVIDLTVQ